ncbi:hypothetical protein ASF45_31700 [Pseudorhodoferax sp. Leaf265]|nr:hypothetical protein ASF45_31700 [Pseudorhodoferax sp. Leaf265]
MLRIIGGEAVSVGMPERKQSSLFTAFGLNLEILSWLYRLQHDADPDVTLFRDLHPDPVPWLLISTQN